MYTTIVVGTDGSEPALAAVRRAGEIAKLLGLEAIHVVAATVPYTPLEMRRIEAELPAEFHDLVSPHMQATDRFSEARAALAESSITLVDHEEIADPANAILDVAQKVDADLIVVGARGLGAVQRFLRGSVSTRVAHHSSCDVLIVEHD